MSGCTLVKTRGVFLAIPIQDGGHGLISLYGNRFQMGKKSCLQLAVKICLLLVLTILFFKVYFINQVTDFAKGLSTVTTSFEYPESFEPPTITICFDEAFKTSAATRYGINSTFDLVHPKTMFPYDEVVYKLDRDFEIVLGEFGPGPSLHKGLNEYDNEMGIFVDFVQTAFYARCTKLTPNFELQSGPTFEYIHVQVILKADLKDEDRPTGLKMYLTSNDSWLSILGDQWNAFQPSVLKMDFKETYNMQLAYLSPSKLLFKHGVASQAKCLDEIKLEMEKCGFDCNPGFPFDSEKSTCLNDNWITNQTLSECARYLDSLYANICVYPKEALIFNPTISTPRYHRKIQNPTIEIGLHISRNKMEIREEKLVTQTHDLIGSLGGSLGMFFGFSIISWMFAGINKIFERF